MNSHETLDLSRDERLGKILAEWLEAVEAGNAPDTAEYLRRYPEFATELAQHLGDYAKFPRFAVPPSPSRNSGDPNVAELPRTGASLGDYVLVRELGRGGMGVVYEARQLSLDRRVALKILTFAATMDAKHLQRFHNEARAAAALEHPHIVPIYGVGSDRGVHYYAMRLVDGQTLADLIKQQRVGAFASDDAPTVIQASAMDTAPVAADTTGTPPRDSAYFRRIAEWGAQAAEALEHAHSVGIVHRDIKPGNLMLDTAGKVWITDFGLARTAADSGLTVTGDVLGTWRYMSPEQALAKHDLVDHRSDIYSLGATLYELLTLHFAVNGDNRATILQQLTQSDPTNPSQLDRRIPADLETIVLKALAKEPEARYGSARELAEDLRRFLEDRPILAKRPGWTSRLTRWSRRHHGLVASTLAFLAVGAVALSVMLLIVTVALNDREEALKEQKKSLIEKELALKEKTEAIGQKEAALAEAKQKEIEATKNAEAAVAEWTKAQHDFLVLTRLAPTLENNVRVLREAGKQKDAREALEAIVTILTRYLDSVLRVAPELRLVRPAQSTDADSRLMSNLAQYERILDLCKNLGEHAKAAELAERLAVFLDRVDRAGKGNFGDVARISRAVAFDHQGSALRQLGQAAAAEKACRDMDAAWKHVADKSPYLKDLSTSWRIPALSRIGELQLDQRKYQEAEASLKEALELAASPPNFLHVTEGQLYWELGQFDQADVAHQKVLKNNRPNATLLEFLVTCPDPKLRDPVRAKQLLEDLQKKKRPWEDPSREWAGVIEYQLGYFQKALDLYAKDQAFPSPVEQQIRNCVTVMAMARLGKTKAAEQILERTKKDIAARDIQHYLVRQFVREAEQMLAAPMKSSQDKDN